MPTRHPSLLSPPVLFAHRGARAHAPENTLEAFDLALELGATGIESDVWRTVDGIAVLDHDGTHGGRLRKRRIGRSERSELPEHIPSLDELYERLDPATPLSLDIKDPQAFEPTVAAARAANAESSLWLCHPDSELLTSWRRATSARLVHSTSLRRFDGSPEQHAAQLRERGIDAVNLRHGEWTGGLVALYHRFERLTLGWDAQQPRHIATLIDAGIDGVFSDHADRLASAHYVYFG